MKHSGTFRWLNFFALLLALPTAYFILIASLKFEMNINGPYDSIAPFLESTGIRESVGWNINLLILFGPLLAALIAIAQVLNFQMNWNADSYRFNFSIRKKWLPISIAAFSGLLMTVLFIYGFVENCNCHQ